MRKLLLIAFIVAIAVFLLHNLFIAYLLFLVTGEEGYYGFWGGVVFGLIFGLWAYFLLSIIHAAIIQTVKSRLHKVVVAIVILAVGYLFARMGDIIDGDFIEKFDLWTLCVFIITVPVLVLLPDYLDKRIHIKR